MVIVIAVIAILAAVLIPTFSGVVDKAKNSADLQEARNIYAEALIVDYTLPDKDEVYVEVEAAANNVAAKYVKFVKGQPQDADNDGCYTDDVTLPDGATAITGAAKVYLPAAQN